MRIASLFLFGIIATISAVSQDAAAAPPDGSCSYSGIEDNQDQWPHRFRDPDGSGFTAQSLFTEGKYGMQVVRILPSGDTAWKRFYHTGSISYHYSANHMAPGPIHVWLLGDDPRENVRSGLRVFSVDPATGDSLGLATLHSDSTGQYLRADFIPTRDGGAASCVNGFVNGVTTLVVYRTDGAGRTVWKSDLRDMAVTYSAQKSYMFTGGAETEDGGLLLAAATFLGSSTGQSFLLFKLDTAGRAQLLGSTLKIPCAIAHNTKRMHYGGRVLTDLSFDLLGPPPLPGPYAAKAWVDVETAVTAFRGKNGRGRSAEGPGSWIYPGGSGSILFRRAGPEGDAGEYGFTADGCRAER
jgi:hypothetical protein